MGVRVGASMAATLVEAAGAGLWLPQAVMKITARSKLTPAAKLFGAYLKVFIQGRYDSIE